MIVLQHDDFSVDECLERMRTDTCGAMVFFVGTVKSPAHGTDVKGLELQAYENMARKRLEAIEQDAIKRFGLEGLLVVHRLGKLDVGDKIVLICATSRGRKGAFDGAIYALERLKEDVPIFKKEYTDQGVHWQG